MAGGWRGAAAGFVGGATGSFVASGFARAGAGTLMQAYQGSSKGALAGFVVKESLAE